MNKPQDDKPAAQPWHEADEKNPKDIKAERSAPREMPPGAEEPDPLAEPRAGLGELLGNKP